MPGRPFLHPVEDGPGQSEGPILQALEPRLLLDGAPEQQALELFKVSLALFAENHGQWRQRGYDGHGRGLPSYAAGAKGGAAADQESEPWPRGLVGGLPCSQQFDPEAYETNALTFSASFVGANRVTPVGLEQSQTVFNYCVADRANWREGVPGYEVVAYEGQKTKDEHATPAPLKEGNS